MPGYVAKFTVNCVKPFASWSSTKPPVRRLPSVLTAGSSSAHGTLARVSSAPPRTLDETKANGILYSSGLLKRSGMPTSK